MYSKLITFNLKHVDNLIFLLISSVIFIQAGNFFEDYKRIMFLKILIIFLISFKIDFLKQIRTVIVEDKIISILFILFIISITISFLTSSFTIDLFLYEWLRVRYLDTVTDIFLFISLYLYFKDRNINYKNLIKSIIIPGIIFSIFLIYTFIDNKGLSDTNKEIIFFDGTRMVGMLITFLVVFYLGYMHSNLQKRENIQNIFILTTFMTLAILLMGRGTIVVILAAYFFMSAALFINKRNFRNEFFVFIFSIFISILLGQIILNIILSNQEINFIFRGIDSLTYTKDRLDLWKYGYIIFLENPYFGKGPGGFAIAAYNDFVSNKSYGDLVINNSFTHNHPHNFIIQFLVEWGIIGTLLIIILLTKMGISSLKYFFKYKKYYLLISGLSIIGLILHGLIDGALYHAAFTFYFVLFLGILCSEISKKTNNRSKIK